MGNVDADPFGCTPSRFLPSTIYSEFGCSLANGLFNGVFCVENQIYKMDKF